MILYLIIIVAAIAVVGVTNATVGGLGWAASFVWLGFALLALVVIDAVVAAIVHAVPEKRIDPFNRYFTVKPKERKIYVRLGVTKWKDIIPESGKRLCGFAKDKVAEPRNNEYILKFLRETCYAEVMHEISLVLSFLPIIWLEHRLTIVLPIAAVNAFLQLLPVIVQRYNRERLTNLYRYNQRKIKNEN